LSLQLLLQLTPFKLINSISSCFYFIVLVNILSGAMENWGCVTYREVDLLVDPITASNSQKQRVAVVVAHELSHQWFGNLVTMAWWDDLWLNEGFASWAENWAVDLLYPEYSMWDQFTTDHLSSALSLDSLKSSHPIQVPIAHAEEVEQVFDAISYCKGGSVVRMIQSVLGMQNFQKGLAAYMKKHAYSNTETFDLWAALEEASGMPVGELMASWTEQMGFPFLRIVTEDWQADKVTFELEQKWFLADGSELDEEGTAKKWTVPILTCTSAGQQQDMTLMREKTASITIPLGGANDWVKLNAGQGAPIRVLPSEEMLQRLSTPIQMKALPAVDRAGLLSDAYAMVKAGHMSPDALIKLVGNYKDEDNYVVWDALSGVLSGLDKVLSDNPTLWAYFKNFARGFVLTLQDKIGWDESDADGHLTSLLRSTMVDLLNVFAHDDPAVVEQATTRFRAFQQDHNDVKSLPSGIRTSVFKIFIKNGGAKEYDEVKSYYQVAETNSEKNRVLSSLGSTEDVKLKQATMEWSTSGEIKLQDFFYPMGSVGRSSRTGREISWQYMQDNFDKIKNMLVGASPSLMDTVIVMCAGGFCSREKADEIQAFFEKNPLPNNTRTIAQMLEAMRTNAQFMDTLVASALSREDFWTSL
jgi:puromycin-sensitive aminopeptidase